MTVKLQKVQKCHKRDQMRHRCWEMWAPVTSEDINIQHASYLAVRRHQTWRDDCELLLNTDLNLSLFHRNGHMTLEILKYRVYGLIKILLCCFSLFGDVVTINCYWFKIQMSSSDLKIQNWTQIQMSNFMLKTACVWKDSK